MQRHHKNHRHLREARDGNDYKANGNLRPLLRNEPTNHCDVRYTRVIRPHS